MAPAEAAGTGLAKPHLGWVLACLSAGAGAIHLAVAPTYSASTAVVFVAVGWFQLVTAAIALTPHRKRALYVLVAGANLSFFGVWLTSRTLGMPFSDDPNVAEPVGTVDLVCAMLELGVAFVAVRLILSPQQRSARFVPALAAVAALGLATVAITSLDVVEQGDGDMRAIGATDLATLQQTLDEQRCDRGFNIPAYYEEADYLGIDTSWGGDPPAVDAAAAEPVQGHAHGASGAALPNRTMTPELDPLEGRGSPGLDQLVSATGQATTGESDVGNLIYWLSAAS